MPNSKADEQPTPEEAIATLRLVRREYGADMSLSGEAFVQMDLAISVLERALKAKDEEIEKAWAAAKYEAGRGADQMTRRLRAEHALASAQRRIGELSEALKEAGCHINSLHDEWSETGKTDAPFPDYIQRALATPIPETKETPAQEADWTRGWTGDARVNFSSDAWVKVWQDGEWVIVHTRSGGAETTISLRRDQAFDIAFALTSELQARFSCAKTAEDALWHFQNIEADPAELRYAADEVDCGVDCDGGWGIRCLEKGNCKHGIAESLRDLATALERKAQIASPAGSESAESTKLRNAAKLVVDLFDSATDAAASQDRIAVAIDDDLRAALASTAGRSPEEKRAMERILEEQLERPRLTPEPKP